MRQKTQYDEWKSNDTVGDELLSRFPGEPREPTIAGPPPHTCRWTTRQIEGRLACDVCGEPEPKENDDV